MKLTFLIINLIFLTALNNFAQFGVQEDLVKIKTFQSFDKVYSGGEFKLALEVSVDEGWHINSDKPYDDYLIPTQFILPDNSNFKLKKVAYPKPQDYKFDFSETPLSVLEGKFVIGALIEADKKIKPGTYNLIVELEYQACNDMSCLPPTSIIDTIEIIVADRKTPVNQINEEIFNDIDLNLTEIGIGEQTTKQSSDPISDALESSGILLGLLLVFVGGLALNLTPCVYPLIPITIGYFGGQSEGSTTRLTMMGLLFVLGLAVTYSLIGVITSLSGAVFGALLQNPIVIITIVGILFVLSLSMFGVYEFKLPDSLVAKAGGAKAGLYGAFFMGLTLGIVAAPCIGPFVIGLVTYVAAKQDPYFGFLMFFMLALGLGLPYMFLAIFSGKIKNLPRAGEWMEAVKHIFGIILLGMALYFLLPILPKDFSGYVLPAFMLISAIYLLFFEKFANKVFGFKIFKIVFSLSNSVQAAG